MNVAIIGTGYVGLVTGVCLASQGMSVVCVDAQPQRVELINRGEPPFYEPGLAERLRSVRENGKFRGSTDVAEATKNADVVMITVGTPSSNGEIDRSFVESALESVGKAIGASSRYHVVVIKSTVIPSTTGTFARPILERSSGKRVGDFGLVMNPEFLREGSAIADFDHPDRIVIGEHDAKSGAVMDELYAAFDCPKFHTSLWNAEMIKYASNSLLATLISFSNELAALCEASPGADIEVVMDGLHLDGRLTPTVEGKRVEPGILEYIRAGSGFGGSCLPKDVSALRHFASDLGVRTPLLDAVLDVNKARPAKVVDLLRQEIGTLQGKRIAMLGLAFKPGTDDIRESAALRAVQLLLDAGADVRLYDPIVFQFHREKIDPRVAVFDDAAATLEAVEGALLLTAWPEFKTWDWHELAALMAKPVLIDGRNALRSVRWPVGFVYRPIGTAKRDEKVALSIG